MKPNRTRLSLEPTLADKAAIIAHGKRVGGRSIIGSIRVAIRRSEALADLEDRGTLWLERKADGEMEDVTRVGRMPCAASPDTPSQ